MASVEVDVASYACSRRHKPRRPPLNYTDPIAGAAAWVAVDRRASKTALSLPCACNCRLEKMHHDSLVCFSLLLKMFSYRALAPGGHGALSIRCHCRLSHVVAAPCTSPVCPVRAGDATPPWISSIWASYRWPRLRETICTVRRPPWARSPGRPDQFSPACPRSTD